MEAREVKRPAQGHTARKSCNDSSNQIRLLQSPHAPVLSMALGLSPEKMNAFVTLVNHQPLILPSRHNSRVPSAVTLAQSSPSRHPSCPCQCLPPWALTPHPTLPFTSSPLVQIKIQLSTWGVLVQIIVSLGDLAKPFMWPSDLDFFFLICWETVLRKAPSSSDWVKYVPILAKCSLKHLLCCIISICLNVCLHHLTWGQKLILIYLFVPSTQHGLEEVLNKCEVNGWKRKKWILDS